MNSGGQGNAPPLTERPALPRFDFDAFVCYRRVDGAPAAQWIARKLTTYRLPKPLAAGRAPLRIYIDRTFARANDDFWEKNVLPALNRSRFLLVIATRAAADYKPGSERWVEKEIGSFERDLRGRTMLFARANGELTDLLPAGLSDRFRNPNNIDLRPASSRISRIRQRAYLHQEALGVIATLYDIEPRDMPVLREQDERRRRHNRRLAYSLILTVIAVIAVLSVFLISSVRTTALEQAQAMMQHAQQSWRADKTSEVVQSLAGVLSVAPRNDPLRTSAMAGLLAQASGMPQMIADLGPIDRAAMSADRGIAVIRRLDGAWETWDAVRHVKLPGPDIAHAESVELSPDSRLAAATVGTLPASAGSYQRVRLVVWAVGQSGAIVDQVYGNTTVDVEWTQRRMLIAHISRPMQMMAWIFHGNSLERASSLPGRFSAAAPRGDSIVRIWKDELTEIDLAKVSGDRLPREAERWRASLPADMRDYAVVSWHLADAFDLVVPAPLDPSGMPGSPGNPTPFFHCQSGGCRSVDANHRFFLSSDPPWAEVSVTPDARAPSNVRMAIVPFPGEASADTVSGQLRGFFGSDIRSWRQGPSEGTLVGVTVAGEVRELDLRTSRSKQRRSAQFAPLDGDWNEAGTELWLVSSAGQILRFPGDLPDRGDGIALPHSGSVLEGCQDRNGSTLWSVLSGGNRIATLHAGPRLRSPQQISGINLDPQHPGWVRARCSPNGEAMLIEFPETIEGKDVRRIAVVEPGHADQLATMEKDQSPWGFAGEAAAGDYLFYISNGTIVRLQNGALIPGCAERFQGPLTFSRDGKMFLLSGGAGFKVRSTASQACAPLFEIPLATNELESSQLIPLAFGEALSVNASADTIEFRFEGGAWRIPAKSRSVEVRSGANLRLSLPTLADEDTPQTFAAISRDGMRLATRNVQLASYKADQAKYDLECYEVWDLGNFTPVRIWGEACSGKSFGIGNPHVVFSQDGSMLSILTAAGKSLSLYVGPAERPRRWSWATAENLAALEKFQINLDGSLKISFGGFCRSYQQVLKELTDDARAGDAVAPRFARIMPQWGRYEGCPTQPVDKPRSKGSSGVWRQ